MPNEVVTPPVVTPPITEPTPPAGGESKPWYDGFSDPDLKGFVEAKGFKDAPALASSYRELEKLRGVPAERLLTLPDKADDTAAWDMVYTRLGRPGKPEEYDMKVPEGVPPEFSKWAQGTFHELGLSKSQGEKLAVKWNELAANDAKTAIEQDKINLQQQAQKLKQEWGAATGQNADYVDSMCKAIGLDEKSVVAMEKAIGFDGFSKLILSIGTKFGIKLGEQGFQGGEGTGFNLLTPSGAKAKREMLLGDPEYRKRYLEGGAKEKQEIDGLYAMEIPSQEQR